MGLRGNLANKISTFFEHVTWVLIFTIKQLHHTKLKDNQSILFLTNDRRISTHCRYITLNDLDGHRLSYEGQNKHVHHCL